MLISSIRDEYILCKQVPLLGRSRQLTGLWGFWASRVSLAAIDLMGTRELRFTLSTNFRNRLMLWSGRVGDKRSRLR